MDWRGPRGTYLSGAGRRLRDIGNHEKAVSDAIEHAGLIDNDSQIDEIRLTRMHVEPPGCCDVTVTEL